MEISTIKLTDIEPAEYNPRQISVEEKKKLRNSLETFGLVDPIIINLKNNRIIGGHQRYDVLLDMILESENLAEKEFDLIKKGDIGLILDIDDLKLENEDYEKALNLALNKISGSWDLDKLESLLEELKLTELDIELTGFDEIVLDDMSILEQTPISSEPRFKTPDKYHDLDEEKYADNIGTIIYEPKETNHNIEDLYSTDFERFDKLIESIQNEDLKTFFTLRKHWFTNFNFKKIADYYAYQATPEEQRVFEALGLVLLDKNQLIENGFAQVIDEFVNDEELHDL